jgi:hypothetical protein
MPLPITTLKDNSTPNPVALQDVGVKLAQPFSDVLTAADSSMIFSSAWPSLAVAARGVTDGSGKFAHNLGFPPLTLGWSGSPASMKFPDFDNTFAYAPTGTFVACFDIDITKDVDYPYTALAGPSYPYDPNYGIKMTIEGRNIDSTDLRDFLLHSRAQSPLVLAVKTEASVDPGNAAIAGVPTIQYTNKLGYQTWVFGYVYSTTLTRYINAPLYAQAYPRLFSDGITSYLSYFDNKASIIVLRDPMFSSTVQQVNY